MKTLIIAAHPNLEESVINKRWLTELRKHPDLCTIHTLSACYPDGRIDVEREHRLIEAHCSLVFQFPIYWFSCPPLLKTWFDEVLTHGWAYGRNGGNKLEGRKVALAVTTGVRAEDYRSTDDTTIRWRSCSPRLRPHCGTTAAPTISRSSPFTAQSLCRARTITQQQRRLNAARRTTHVL